MTPRAVISKPFLPASFYRQQASFYDRLAPTINSRYVAAHEVQNKLILQHLVESSCPTILDLGCGTATDGVDLLRELPTAKYIGLDVSQAMLKKAREKMKAAGVEGRAYFFPVDFTEGDDQRFLDLSKTVGEAKVDVVISAFTFHHYSTPAKGALYRAIAKTLSDGGWFVLTDLLLPNVSQHQAQFLKQEIEDIAKGLKSAKFLSKAQKRSLLRLWVDHYRVKNLPLTVADEMALMEKVGFTECQLAYQHWQNSVIVAGKSGLGQPAVTFDGLLGELQQKLTGIDLNPVTGARRDEIYEELFTSDEAFRERFYRFFGISGATFVVADNLAGRFVMLQEGAEDAEAYAVKLAMPISEAPDGAGLLARMWGNHAKYNRFINRIFQIQRGHEGLRAYGDKLALTHEPEFLARLQPGTGDAEGNTQTTEDWHYCSGEIMFHEIVQWRWLLWLINHGAAGATLGRVLKDLRRLAASTKVIEDQYLSKSFFRSFPFLKSSDYPESAIPVMDAEMRRGDYPWEQLRRKCDAGMRRRRSFSEEIALLRKSFYGLSISDDALIERTHKRLIRFFGETVEVKDALKRFHAKAKSPVCPYFYFVCADGRPKEHFVVSVLRSDVSPLTYYLTEDGKTKRKKHTAVVIALASLNCTGVDRSTLESRKHVNLLQLKTVLHVCANRIIDKVFVRSLMLKERKSSAIRRERILELSRCKKTPRVFILGSFDNRITFYSQQSRAFMLIRAMHEARLIHAVANGTKKTASMRVAVVGGGIAGLTAAVALTVLGCKVTVYEKDQRLMPIQSGADHRFIHPHIAYWPKKLSMVADAQLPLLNWSAAPANKVIEEIYSGFEDFQAALRPSRKIVVELSKRVGFLVSDEQEVSLGTRRRDAVNYDLCVVAIGFGLEGVQLSRNETYVDSILPYWQDDNLGSRVVGPQKRIIISGTGDGALIDLARASMASSAKSPTFNHQEVLDRLADDQDFRAMGISFHEADRKAEADILLTGKKVDLYDRYQAAFSALGVAIRTRLEQVMSELQRKDTDVTFVYRDMRLNSSSILFNRCLAFLLIHFEFVKAKQGATQGTTVKGEKRIVSISKAGIVEELECDVFLRRHGVAKNHVARTIPALKGAATELKTLAQMEIAEELDQATYEFFVEKASTLVPSLFPE